MPSHAFNGHLVRLLEDAVQLQDAHVQLRSGRRGRQYGLAALNRAAVVLCVSAWEAYVEELVRESLNALRPATQPLGVWPALHAATRAQLGRFNTPNTDQVRVLLSDTIGLQDIQLAWNWPNCTSAQAVQRLARAMDLRHQIAHGVNPRPTIHNPYSSQLPDFFSRLGRCTDNAVRDHLANTLGITDPWPP